MNEKKQGKNPTGAGKNFTEQFTKRLKALRLQQFRSGVTFAKKIDIPHSTYGHYENSAVAPADHIHKIAQALGVSIHTLITGTEPPAATSPDAIAETETPYGFNLVDYLFQRLRLAEQHIERLEAANRQLNNTLGDLRRQLEKQKGPSDGP